MLLIISNFSYDEKGESTNQLRHLYVWDQYCNREIKIINSLHLDKKKC